ncbi:hypothetical protein ACFP47_08935 [Nesterenkonia lacusekhoensis]|uniref:NIPSNAP domain-containing protein n=1 Tax=Nesterenkonia lacusekhoensis TaxID=150832 RepID=A0ABS4SZ34_9MICC|nr:hypothetical protein [Nesterenkonia lacusekhoensis]MBP2317459.1 hypothetical protein [Nesterenkonia lacusekhoensis]
MTELPEGIAGAEQAERTTMMRRYTTDPQLLDEFVQFLHTEVFPAREQRGFTVESVWLSAEKDELTWFVSRPGTREEFDRAEKEWEESEERARIFDGRPAYVLAKDIRPVTRLR